MSTSISRGGRFNLHRQKAIFSKFGTKLVQISGIHTHQVCHVIVPQTTIILAISFTKHAPLSRNSLHAMGDERLDDKNMSSLVKGAHYGAHQRLC